MIGKVYVVYIYKFMVFRRIGLFLYICMVNYLVELVYLYICLIILYSCFI